MSGRPVPALPIERPELLDRRFEALLFDWDGTAVADRRADASAVRGLVEDLCAMGMDIGVVSGTSIANVDSQLAARPHGPGNLWLLLDRGSSIYLVGPDGPRLRFRRRATRREEKMLDQAAGHVREWLEDRRTETRLISDRLNRRKIDLIPEAEWRDPPKAQIKELLAAVQLRLRSSGTDLSEAWATARHVAAGAGLSDPRVTTDAKHLEIGLTDKRDSARWFLDEERRSGIVPAQVLVVGDEMGSLGGVIGSDALMIADGSAAVSVGVEPEGVPGGVLHVPGGTDAFEEILRDQLERRSRRDIPEVAGDADWTIEVDGINPLLQRVYEAQFTLGDGAIGTRGIPLSPSEGSRPDVFAAGLYRGEGSRQELVPCPAWNDAFHVDDVKEVLRTFDLRTGVQRYEATTADGPISAFLFSSLDSPGTVALRANGLPRGIAHPRPLLPPRGDAEALVDGDAQLMRVAGHRGGAVVAAHQEAFDTSIERLAVYDIDTRGVPEGQVAISRLREAQRRGFEVLLRAHRRRWIDRWNAADVVIEGDLELQRAVRFNLFHLMANVGDRGEAAVGARGLTGRGYRGHVFWDADVFVLPFLAATHPPAARAMLEYRVRRLPNAARNAKEHGWEGARFPWESALDGIDVTPKSATDRTGARVAIRTGDLEEHVVADVAWAAARYIDWSGDRAFEDGSGRAMLIETARYWASRVEFDDQGRAHILHVIGPDEYHEAVDDNAFTNVMARWNLRRAADAADGGVSSAERQRWLNAADALIDGYDETSGLYEQFRGFFDLDPILIANLAPRRPVAADLLLGVDRVRSSQVIKQADVLMLHHLVPNETAPGSLAANLAFYEPRTAHGSSLSPGIHASLLARAGRLDEAVAALQVASRIDLDDLTGTTASGLHMASMGTVWQALAYGFGGVSAASDGLHLDPKLPSQWQRLELNLRYRSASVRVGIEHDTIDLSASSPTRIHLNDQESPVTATPSGVRLTRKGDT
jgi:trehalose/maltose hydrolase-like predicted phosphorylase